MFIIYTVYTQYMPTLIYVYFNDFINPMAGWLRSI
jgi:hypothetical protein